MHKMVSAYFTSDVTYGVSFATSDVQFVNYTNKVIDSR